MADRAGHVRVGWIREDATHDALMDRLLPRIAADEVDWLEVEDAAHILKRVGLGGAPHLDVKATPHLRGPDGRRLKDRGHIAGRRLEPEARMWRRALLAFQAEADPPDIVLICRDGDGYARTRRAGFEQVARDLSWPFDLLLAMPDPEAEAWFVAGFVPADDDEQRALDALTRALSFDPTAQPHRLTAHPNDAPTDAKRVCERLTANAPGRLAACLAGPLDALAARGEAAGLKVFVDDARAILRRHI